MFGDEYGQSASVITEIFTAPLLSQGTNDYFQVDFATQISVQEGTKNILKANIILMRLLLLRRRPR